MGEYLKQGLLERLSGQDLFEEIRGRGLMLGLVLKQDCSELMAQAVEEGLLINVTAGNVIRLLPPLVLQKAEADIIIDKLVRLINSLTPTDSGN